MNELTPQDRDQVLPKIYSSKEQLDRAHDFVIDQLKRVQDDHRSRGDKWKQWDMAYRLIDEQRPDQGSAVVDPEIQIEIDTLVANEVEALMGKNPPFQFIGTEETDEEQAELMTAYVADGLKRIQLREKLERTIRQKKIYGTAFVKTPYVKDTVKRKVRKIVDRDEKGKVKTEVKEVDFLYMDDTDWEYVSIFDIYPIGPGSNLQETEGVVQLFERTYDQLLEREFHKESDGTEHGVYHHLDAVAPAVDKKLKVAEYWGKIPMSVITGNPEDKFKKFEGLITAVIEFPDNDDSKREVKNIHSLRTGEQSHTPETSTIPTCGGIRMQENPFWDNSRPFLSCPDTPVDDEIYGVGVIEILFEKWSELNTTIRQVADSKTLQNLNPTIEDVNAGIKRDLKLTQNPRIKANDINGIKPLPIKDSSATAYTYIAQLKNDMRRASGATEGIQGTPVSGDQSATEFAAIQQQAGVRIKGKIKLSEERLFIPFVERCYKNAMQFATAEKFIRVHGVKGVRFQPVKPEDIWGTFDIVTKGATESENSIIIANKLIQYLSIAAKAPQHANIPFLLQEIWVKIGMPESQKHKVVLVGSNETQMDIQDEIDAMVVGQQVNAKPSQNHQLHIQMKADAFQGLIEQGLTTPENTVVFRENLDAHAQMLAVGQAEQGMAAPPEQFPLANEAEAPNPLEEQLGPSTQGSGITSI